MNSRSCLIVSRSAPYGSSAARDTLDVALTCAVFEMPVTILLLDDAVLQLLKNQTPDPIHQKNLNAIQQSLPLYDIERICVSRKALEARGVSDDQLILPVERVDAPEIQTLLTQHDIVLSI